MAQGQWPRYIIPEYLSLAIGLGAGRLGGLLVQARLFRKPLHLWPKRNPVMEMQHPEMDVLHPAMEVEQNKIYHLISWIIDPEQLGLRSMESYGCLRYLAGHMMMTC